MKNTLFLLALTAAVGLHAADWPRFRGPNGDGIAPDTKLPTKLSPQSISWAANLPGRGISSPIVVGDRLFVTCSSGPRQEQLHVLCFNVADGSLRWGRQYWATGRTMTHEKIAAAAPSPASDGKYIYAIFSSNDCLALDFDGNLVWYRGLGRDYPNASNSLGMASSLLVVDGILVAQVENDSESFVAGLDTATGINRWKVERPKRANWTSPGLLTGLDGKSLVLVQSSKGLAALSPTDGHTVWNYAEGASTLPSTTVSEGKLYVPSFGITVLEPTDGAVPKQIWRASQLRPETSSPLVQGGKLFSLNDGGILTCASTGDGKRLWQLRLKGPFSSSPVSAGGYIYCVNENGLLQVVDPALVTDREKPEAGKISELDLGQTVIGTPSIAAGSLFVRSDSKLWRIGNASAL